MTIDAFAIRQGGRLLVHTIRPSAGAAWDAAGRGIKQAEGRWTALERQGYAVVRV